MWCKRKHRNAVEYILQNDQIGVKRNLNKLVINGITGQVGVGSHIHFI